MPLSKAHGCHVASPHPTPALLIINFRRPGHDPVSVSLLVCPGTYPHAACMKTSSQSLPSAVCLTSSSPSQKCCLGKLPGRLSDTQTPAGLDCSRRCSKILTLACPGHSAHCLHRKLQRDALIHSSSSISECLPALTVRLITVCHLRGCGVIKICVWEQQ